MGKVERRKERELAFWGIFKEDFGSDETTSMKELLKNFSDEENTPNTNFKYEGYADEIVKAFLENRNEVDALIEQFLKEGWSLDRLAKPDKAILQTATTEMLFTDDPVPKEIAINEAIILAKRYCETNSKNYINAVLNQIGKKQKPTW